jgi:hypothetical protein
MGKLTHPPRIFATVNGASTRLPDGGRQLLGGWSEDKDRPGAVEYVRADIADDLTTAYMAGFEAGRAALKESVG